MYTAIKEALNKLIDNGENLSGTLMRAEAAKELIRRGKTDKRLTELAKERVDPGDYQRWYSAALPVIKQLLPERYTEFQECYRLEKRKEINAATYTISDYFNGITITRGIDSTELFNRDNIFQIKFHMQVEILQSAIVRIDSILTNIKGTLQAELFDNELAVAEDLMKKNHLRAAGAIAGVVTERHLGQVAQAHAINLNKKDPSISDYNDALKNASVLDIPNWRLVQRLGDIRNLCVHSKEREPTLDEVEDLIRGAEKVVKTLF